MDFSYSIAKKSVSRRGEECCEVVRWQNQCECKGLRSNTSRGEGSGGRVYILHCAKDKLGKAVSEAYSLKAAQQHKVVPFPQPQVFRDRVGIRGHIRTGSIIQRKVYSALTTPHQLPQGHARKQPCRTPPNATKRRNPKMVISRLLLMPCRNDKVLFERLR